MPLPTLWLFTDPRAGDPVAAARALPKGAGIVFRHYGVPGGRALFDAVARVARARRQVLILADTPTVARAWGADGAHHRSARSSLGRLRTVAVHSVRDRVLASRIGADLIFVSPVFPTASHPGARPIGRLGLYRIAGPARGRTIALGGMRGPIGRVYGWAAIDALHQKRKAVPT